MYPSEFDDKVLAIVTASLLSIPAIFDNCCNSVVSSFKEGFENLFCLLYHDSRLDGSFGGDADLDDRVEGVFESDSCCGS